MTSADGAGASADEDDAAFLPHPGSPLLQSALAVRLARGNKGWKRYALAIEAGVAERTVEAFEEGRLHTPVQQLRPFLRAVAQALGIDADRLELLYLGDVQRRGALAERTRSAALAKSDHPADQAYARFWEPGGPGGGAPWLARSAAHIRVRSRSVGHVFPSSPLSPEHPSPSLAAARKKSP